MIKRLLPLLLLFACPVWGATTLDKAFACDETVQNVTSASYVDAANTLTFTPTGVADYVILAHVSIEVSNVDTIYSVQLNHDSGTGSGVVWEIATTQAHRIAGDSTNHYGSMWNFVAKKASLAAVEHVFSVEVKRTAGTGNVEVENACIFAMEFSAGAEYAEVTTLVETDSSTSEVVAVGLSFTATNEEYVTFFSGHFSQEDDSGGFNGIDFQLNGGQLFCDHGTWLRDGQNEAADPSPILVGYSAGCVAVETLAAGTRVFEISITGGGGADEGFMQRGAIFTMPTAEFEAFYAVEATARSGAYQGIAESPWQDDVTPKGNPLGAITQTLAAKTHLFATSVSTAVEAPNSSVGFCRMNVAGTGRSEMRFPDDRDEDSNDYYSNFALWVETFASSASRTIKNQCNSSSNTNSQEAKFRFRTLLAAEIPEAAAGGRTRRMF